MVFSVIIENITLNRGEKQMFTDIEKEYKKCPKKDISTFIIGVVHYLYP